MATKILSLRAASQRILNLVHKNALMPARNNAVCTGTGAVLPKPEQIRFPVIKALAVAVPFLYAGATFSKNAAAFLEENDIFVPDDDDD